MQQTQILYPNGDAHYLQSNGLNEDIPNLVHQLESHEGYQVIGILTIGDEDETYTDWDYIINIPDINMKDINDNVLEDIIKFWDFNRMDDQLIFLNIDYLSNIVHIRWRSFC